MKRLLPIALLLAACATTPAPSPAPALAAPVPRDTLADLAHWRVDYWVERFSKGDKRPEIEAAFARMPEVEAMIRGKLSERGMPEDLVYLAMAESGFNPAAHSTAEAIGIWQLVADTARRHGLKVDESMDERRDAEKSTDAALAYLAKLYDRFGSWYLAAAAYNAGENRIGRIMTEATGAERGTDDEYYRIWDRLPGETRDFVPAMVALRKLGREPARYGFKSASVTGGR